MPLREGRPYALRARREALPGLRQATMTERGVLSDEPIGRFDVHTILGAIWRHYGVLTPCMIWMLRSEYGWKIEPIEDEV